MRDLLPAPPRLAILGPERIRALSHGEVKNGKMFDRMFKPEQGGLFCSKIFGPMKDFECQCGKVRGREHAGTTCEDCGVEVIESAVRRTRFGHVELEAPVLHPWLVYLACKLLGWSDEDLRRVLEFERYVRPETGAFVTEDEVQATGDEDVFTGTHGVLARLGHVATDLIDDPTLVMIRTLPVLPPNLRPFVPLDGVWESNDVNELYRGVIDRNARLSRLKQINAPEIILREEARQLQEAVTALLDNEHQAKHVRDASQRPLCALRSLTIGALRKDPSARCEIQSLCFAVE